MTSKSPLTVNLSPAQIGAALTECKDNDSPWLVCKECAQVGWCSKECGLAVKATGTEAEVCRDIAQRQQHGIAKYGVTVRNNPLPLRAWLQHAYEECMDQAVYLKRAIQNLDDEAKGKKP